MPLKPELIVATARLNGCRRIILALLFLCPGILVPENALGETSLAPLILSNVTLPPVTTPAGDGYLDKLYDEWFARDGLRAELVAVPAARGLVNANAGLFDGDAARIELDSSLYPNLHRIPEPVIAVVFSGLHFDSDIINVKTPVDFAQYRVGYVRGWRIAERLFGGFADAIAVRNAESLLEMLAANRLDIVFLTVAPARNIARRKNMKLLSTTDFKIEKQLFLQLHSSHRNLIPELTDTLKAMKADGSYDLIMDEYIVENR